MTWADMVPDTTGVASSHSCAAEGSVTEERRRYQRAKN